MINYIKDIFKEKQEISKENMFLHTFILGKTGSGKASTILNDRQTILNELFKWDSWDKPELNKERINCFTRLKKQINIDELKQQYTLHNINTPYFKNIPGKELTTLLTYRQINSISRVFLYLNQNKLPEAYHSLVEFIDNYQYTLHEPLNDYEKLLMSLAIEQFEFHFKYKEEYQMTNQKTEKERLYKFIDIKGKGISTLISQNKFQNMSPEAKDKMIELMKEFADEE